MRGRAGKRVGRRTTATAAWLAVSVGVAAVLAGCGGATDGGSGSKSPSASPTASAPTSEGSAGTGGSRNPTSEELDFTWGPDISETPMAPLLAIRDGEAMMPTQHRCMGRLTFGAEVTLSFPCGDERSQGTLRVNESADRLTVAWADGATDQYEKREDLTGPDLEITGTPGVEDIDRQVDELEDMVEEMIDDSLADLGDLGDLGDLDELGELGDLGY